MRYVARLILRGYQLFISPLLGNHCRYYPSCSQYALDAVERFGVLRGAWLALLRIARCHPWHPGGVDPVPDNFHWLARFEPADGDDAEQDTPRSPDASAPSPNPTSHPPPKPSSCKHHG